MSLLNDLRLVCEQLVADGWRDFICDVSHGFDICKYSDAAFPKLLREYKDVNRTVEGLADFAKDRASAIEPGVPAFSFLYHILASPSVVPPGVKRFPTLKQLEVVENYVYGVEMPSIADLRELCPDAPLALVVFTSEYRPAADTVHQLHADMCYSRTGVARIGTHGDQYIESARGYGSIGPRPTDSRVIPCRYAAYVAARMLGDFKSFGPLRPRKLAPLVPPRVPSDLDPDPKDVDTGGDPVTPDDKRFFWVPIHKVFSGTECVKGLDLDLTFDTFHQNEKIRRLHLFLAENRLPSKYSGSMLNQFPFVVDEATLLTVHQLSTGSVLIAPNPHKLAEEALHNKTRLAFHVPRGGTTDGAAFRVPSRPLGGRSAPEYIYVRQEIDSTGNLKSLNGVPQLVQKVNQGGYDAQLYVDYSGDGWIAARCEALALALPRSLAAYSMLAPPDPLPAVSEQDVYDWWTQSAPPDVRKILFPTFEQAIPPEPLSDARITANITYRQHVNQMHSEPVFDSEDDSYTAIVSRLGGGRDAKRPLTPSKPQRVSALPDGSSGLFAPGWEVSMDQNDDEHSQNAVLHLAAYGGSIPFLEDERLCAAQSAFWPSVSPDTTRLYEPGKYHTVTPIPDSLLGFDGLDEAPELMTLPSGLKPGIVRTYSLAHTDYIDRQNQGFDLQSLSNISADLYERWTLLMARVYVAIDANTTQEKSKWSVVDFDKLQKISRYAIDLPDALAGGIAQLDPYYFFLVKSVGRTQDSNPQFVLVSYQRFVVALATPTNILYYDSDMGSWQKRVF